MASRITKTEWITLYAITGIIDVAQISIDLFFTEVFAAPEIINEIVDAAVGVGLLAYFPLRGVRVFSHMGRFASMLGMEALTDITGGLASFWILEIWYMHRSVRQEQAEEAAEQEQEEALRANAAIAPRYQEMNGEMMRLPKAQQEAAAQRPANTIDGIRPPNGGLNPAA